MYSITKAPRLPKFTQNRSFSSVRKISNLNYNNDYSNHFLTQKNINFVPSSKTQIFNNYNLEPKQLQQKQQKRDFYKFPSLALDHPLFTEGWKNMKKKTYYFCYNLTVPEDKRYALQVFPILNPILFRDWYRHFKVNRYMSRKDFQQQILYDWPTFFVPFGRALSNALGWRPVGYRRKKRFFRAKYYERTKPYTNINVEILDNKRHVIHGVKDTTDPNYDQFTDHVINLSSKYFMDKYTEDYYSHERYKNIMSLRREPFGSPYKTHNMFPWTTRRSKSYAIVENRRILRGVFPSKLKQRFLKRFPILLTIKRSLELERYKFSRKSKRDMLNDYIDNVNPHFSGSQLMAGANYLARAFVYGIDNHDPEVIERHYNRDGEDYDSEYYDYTEQEYFHPQALTGAYMPERTYKLQQVRLKGYTFSEDEGTFLFKCRFRRISYFVKHKDMQVRRYKMVFAFSAFDGKYYLMKITSKARKHYKSLY